MVTQYGDALIYIIRFLSERIRGKDLRPDERVFLVQPEMPADHMRRSKTYMAKNSVHPEMAPHKSITVVY